MKVFIICIVLIGGICEANAYHRVFSNVAQNFTSVWSNGKGKVVAGCDEGMILLSNDDGKNWRRSIISFANSISIKEVHGMNNNLSVVTEDGNILYSTDGGMSFSFSTVYSVNDRIISASINDEGAGIAISDSLKIFHTTNGGEEWSYANTLKAKYGIARCLTTDRNYYISLVNGITYYSSISDIDNWKVIDPFEGDVQVGIPISMKYFNDKVLCSFERGCYSLTTDNVVGSLTKFPFFIRDVVINEADSIYCCNDYSVFGLKDKNLYTISTKSISVFHENTQIVGIVWSTRGALVFGSNMTIALAHERGRWYYESWLPVYDFSFKSVETTSVDRIYMVGEGQYLLHSTNKGLTWIPNDTLIQETNQSVSPRASIDNILVNSNVVKLYSGQERIKDFVTNSKFLDYRSLDSGNTLKLRASFLPRTDLNTTLVPLTKDSYLLSHGILGSSGGANPAPNRGVLWKTTDNGINWNYIRKSDTAFYAGMYKKNNDEIVLLRTVAPLGIGGSSTASTLYIAAEICHSKDGGVTFYDSVSIKGLSKSDSFMKMKNDSLGYLYSRESTGIGTEGRCVLFRTVDGGFHWTKISSPVDGAKDSRIISFNLYGEGKLIICTVQTESNSNLLFCSTDYGSVWKRLEIQGKFIYKQGFMIDSETMLITCVDYEQNRNKLLFVKLSDFLTSNVNENEISVAPVYLWNPYPNPAGKSTTIDLQWGMTTTKEEMALDVYDITGRKVADLKNLLPLSGKPGDRLRLLWEIEDGIPNGMYYMVLKARGFTKTRSFAILRN